MKKLIACLALLSSLTALCSAATTDLSYPPTTSAGHDFNHAPVGQSFTALASSVRGGIFLADDTSFTAWLATIYPGQIVPGSYPYTVAPSISVRIDLLAGEGTGGAVLHSTTRTLTAPFMGFVDVDYAAAGVVLTVGQKYSVVVTDISGQSYPQGVTGWVVPSVTDSSGAGIPVTDSNGNVVGYLPYGAYYGGLPIVQGTLVTDDAGVGDTSFQMIDTGSATAPLLIATTSLPNGTVGEPYSATIMASGGVPPYTGVVSGLPAGLTCDGANLTGTPLASGTSNLNVTVVDDLGQTASANLTLTIAPATTTSSNYTIKDEGKGKITAIGAGYVMVGSKKLIWNSSTVIIVNTPDGVRSVIDSFVKVGMVAQWKGLRDKTKTVLTSKLEIN